MERKQNDSFLLTNWLVTVIAGAVLIFLLVRSFQQGNYWVVFLTIGFMLAVIFTYKVQINRLLHADSPQPLIDYYEKIYSRRPTHYDDTLLAFSKALSYTLYGRFDSARTEVEKTDWEQKPPIFQALKVCLQALWAYLEDHDFQQGTALAKEARRLAEVSSSLPGAGISLSSHDAIVEIGELLSGNMDPAIVTSLREKLQRLPILMKVFIAWGLERFYDRSGDEKQAQEMRDLLTKIAPHCKGLTRNVQVQH